MLVKAMNLGGASILSQASVPWGSDVSVSTTVGILQEPILGKHLAQTLLDKSKLSLLDFSYD